MSIQLNIGTGSKSNLYEEQIQMEKERQKRVKKNVPVKTFTSVLASSVQPKREEREVIEEEPEEFIIQPTKDSTFSTDGIESLGMSPQLTEHLKSIGYHTLTHVQKEAYEPIMSGRDVLIKSETGSGKTLAMVLPMIQKLINFSQKTKVTRDMGTLAIIISPTRELSIQLESVIHLVSQKHGWLITGTLMGGEKKKSEKARIRKGITILIATPGRLLDHLQNTSSFKHDNLKFIIMDEADRLLDLGFEVKINEALDYLRQGWKDIKPQVILTSATLNSKIMHLSDKNLHNPLRVGFEKSQKDVFSVPKALNQHFALVPLKMRLVILISFLRSKTEKLPAKLIVFFSCCQSVEFHYELFNSIKINDMKDEGGSLFNCKVFKLHGDMSQKDRTRIYFEYVKSESGILLCTDVAARGLDINEVSWILQYDPPSEPKDYLHRIGRTARLDNRGSSIIFLQAHEEDYVKLLEKYQLKLNTVSAEHILEALIPTFNRRTTDVMEAANIMQAIIDQKVESDQTIHKMAVDAFVSSIRAYGSHSKDTKYLFHVKNIHQGHMAKSFGLKEKPTDITRRYEAPTEVRESSKPGKLSANEKLQRYKDFQSGKLPQRPRIQLPNDQRTPIAQREKMGGNTKRAHYEMVNEFGSGMEMTKKKKYEK